jgi:hypothetical protein
VLPAWYSVGVDFDPASPGRFAPRLGADQSAIIVPVVTVAQRTSQLPSAAAACVIEVTVVAAAPPFAHIDPRRPHVDNRAGLYAISPSYLLTTSEPPQIVTNGSTDGFAQLCIYGMALGPNTQGVMSVDLKIGNTGHGPGNVEITATNNPVMMILTGAATGYDRVNVQVPFRSRQDGTVVACLRPSTVNDGFAWLGAHITQF